MAETHTIATTTHGRYLVDRPQGDGALPVLVGFHGYAERAEDMLTVLQQIRGERGWLLVSIQALHPFYTRAQTVVANWMTREDRELAIADNISYVTATVEAVRQRYDTTDCIVYAGFSQGVAMAYRAAAFAGRAGADVPRASAVILLAGDVPPDVVPHLRQLPPLLVGRGSNDDWYTQEKADADARRFADAGVTPEQHVFTGGHVWEASFVAAAGRFLDRRAPAPSPAR